MKQPVSPYFPICPVVPSFTTNNDFIGYLDLQEKSGVESLSLESMVSNTTEGIVAAAASVVSAPCFQVRSTVTALFILGRQAVICPSILVDTFLSDRWAATTVGCIR